MENAYFPFMPVGCDSAVYVAQAGVDCYSNGLLAAYHFLDYLSRSGSSQALWCFNMVR